MGFFEKIKNGLKKTRAAMANTLGGIFASFSGANEEFYEELEESMILADIGVETSCKAVEQLRTVVKERKLRTAEEIHDALKDILVDMLNVGDTSLKLGTRPSVVLVIGVNGVGKTTTIGKLAHRLSGEGKRVLLCAADTFRAAAADQLEIWAGRANVDIVRQHEGADPAAVVFDAISAAKARGSDVILCDTAGRLHNKANLMNELGKISRIIDRELPNADKEVLLVLDGTTGQNGLLQAKQFKEIAGVTAIALTKLDGTAKGGIVIAVADDSGLMVDALNGEPGVYSARYGGPDCISDSDRINYLLKKLENVPEGKRTAKFVSVITLVTPDGKEIVARGECPGHILFERHGNGGFGYDPVFFAEDAGCTFAELAPEQKNQVSHRARALRAFVEKAFGTKKEKELC